ncbi:M28 family peptidase [Clostridium sp.]|uniref:M28 family peptidase n=1 Tax=Clostridium sp. TaxID=1506 RepID=UPI003464A120
MFKNFKLTISLLLISIFLLTGCSNQYKQSSTEVKDPVVESEEITIPNAKDIVTRLCSDEFQGRKVGEKGNKLTEEYLYNIFSDLELDTVFKDSFYHNYTYEVSENHDTTITTNKEANNVVGKISGTNNQNALVISAHFDHLGIKDGKLFKGAIDNASGSAALIKLANELKTKSKTNQFNFDIIFAAFNGEEYGFYGSTNFVNDISKSYSKIYNINIDSIGYKNGGDIVFMNILLKNKKDKEYDKLYSHMKTSFKNNNLNISNKVLSGVASDEFSFQNKGHTSIWITEENIKDVINTENDSPELVDYERIDSVVKSIYDSIINFNI